MPRFALGAAWVAALLALWAYVQTLSPTVAWVNDGEDSGDLLAAAATLGIPHPTGYPLFVLLGRVASLAPLGSVAFRINLVSALAGAASVLFLARLVLEVAPSRRSTALPLAAAAALAYAFARGPWSQSVVAEVYTLNAAFLGAALWALARAHRTGSSRHLFLAAYLVGLGLTNHLLLLAAAPALVLVAWRLAASRLIGPAGILLLPLLTLWGLTLDLYLPIRAGRGPEFSWGVPTSPDRLWWVLSGAQYAGHLFARSAGEALRVLAPSRWAAELGWGWALATVGIAAVLWRRPRGALLPASAAALALALHVAYAIPDDVGYRMPLLYMACALAGAGWILLAEGVSARWPRAAIAAAAVAAPLLAYAGNAARVDASRDVRPWIWARRSLEAVEPNALIVSEYDGRTFALWFYKATEFRRSHPELVVAYKYLLVWPWYQQHLARTYRTLAVPPYPGAMDAMMNRLVARNLGRRPVYLIRKDPGLLPIFELEPVGHPPDPIYRVRRKDRPS